MLRAVEPLPGARELRASLATLGDEIVSLAGAGDGRIPDGAGDLTVQVGLGPRLVNLAGADLPGARELPAFDGSAGLSDLHRGGDLVLQVAASRPGLPTEVADLLVAGLPDFTVAWSQVGSRAPGEGTITRNPLGFHDGVVQPDAEAIERDVWIGAGPAAGGTIGVVRRFDLDLAGFTGLTHREQEAVLGRDRVTGAPLSGGALEDEIDLRAKTPEGAYVVPLDAHARAAHPSFTGSPLMLRRSYGFRDSLDRAGLLFISFQNDLDVFARTQSRLDRVDRLMTYATPTAEATFLVLPGFTADRPLGSTLFG